MAHFLGASGASRFIRAAEANPNAKAAAFFPRAAHANNSIFYDKAGQARSLKQVYAGLVSRHNVIGNTQIAEAKSSDAVQSAGLAAPLPRARPLLPEAPPSPMVNVAIGHARCRGRRPAPAASTATATDAPATFAERVAMVSEATASASTHPHPLTRASRSSRCSRRCIIRISAGRWRRSCASCGAHATRRRSRQRPPCRLPATLPRRAAAPPLTRRSISSASCGLRRGVRPSAAAAFGALNNPLTIPKSYGEPFVKPHGLTCAIAARDAACCVGWS